MIVGDIMPKLILIHGPIASGKTTITQQLLTKLKDYAFIDRAYIKDMLKPSGKNDAKIIADKVVILALQELMKLNKNILVQERNTDELRIPINNYGKKYNIYSFYLECSLDEAIKRDQLRIKKSGNINQINDSYNKVKPNKDDIIINTQNNSINKCVQDILRKICSI